MEFAATALISSCTYALLAAGMLWLVAQLQRGYVSSLEAGLRAGLAEAYRRWSAGEELPRPTPTSIEIYDRKRSTAKLKALLEELVGRHERRNGTA